VARQVQRKAANGGLVKDFYDVLRQKETDLARAEREVEALKLVISLLEEHLTTQTQDDHSPTSESTGTEGAIFSSIGRTESSFWKRKK
jgi:hypothetical protein